MAIVIIIETSDNITTELPILSKTVIGRSSSSDLKIDDHKISGKHCSFEMTPHGELILTDLGSTNGTFINNSQIHKSVVKVNDTIRIGNTRCWVDDKQLTIAERLKIGVNKISIDFDEKTIPLFPNPNSSADGKSISIQHSQKVINEKEKGEAARKAENADPNNQANNKSIVKKAQPKKENLASWGMSNDQLIEQEESSGKTRFLKLDKKQGVIKKK